MDRESAVFVSLVGALLMVGTCSFRGAWDTTVHIDPLCREVLANRPTLRDSVDVIREFRACEAVTREALIKESPDAR